MARVPEPYIHNAGTTLESETVPNGGNGQNAHAEDRSQGEAVEDAFQIVPGPGLLARINRVRHAVRHNQSWLSLITAEEKGTGWGKSSLAQYLAYLIDTDWNPWRATFTGGSFLKRCLEERETSFVVWDEIADGGNRRRAMSRGNVATMDFFTSWREQHIAAAMCYPHAGRVDSAHWEYCDSWINIDHALKSAVWRDIHLKTVWTEGRPSKVLRMGAPFAFRFPDMAQVWPAKWNEYRRLKLMWLQGKKKGLEPEENA